MAYAANTDETARMRKMGGVIRVGLVLGSVVAGLGSATSNSAAPGSQSVPALKRNQIIHGDVLGDISIGATPLGAAGWRLSVENKGDAAASINWDESSFVGSTGTSGGRLIPGETRKIDLEKSHAPMPLPPHASVQETVFVEKLVDAEENEAMHGDMVSPEYRQTLLATRDKLARFEEGGKMYLSLQLQDGKKLWTGLVENRLASPVPKSDAPPSSDVDH